MVVSDEGPRDSELKVANVTWSFSDDVIFHNLALVLYANGCKWACHGCHNKKLQCFEPVQDIKFSDISAITEYITDRVSNSIQPEKITVVGSGGDFYFQLPAWKRLCKELKMLYPHMPIIWYTGAEFTQENTALLGDSVKYFDAILWGKLKTKNGRVLKTVSRVITAHSKGEEILLSEYNPEFEDIDLESEKKNV